MPEPTPTDTVPPPTTPQGYHPPLTCPPRARPQDQPREVREPEWQGEDGG